MISYKDKEKIKRYTQNIMANEDADYIIHFISLTDEEKLIEINEMLSY